MYLSHLPVTCQSPTQGADIRKRRISERKVGAVSLLELHDVSKSYGEGATEVCALDAVDLSVDGGQLVAVTGPSGSGKSTLLTIAGSLEEPTSGEVRVAGTTLSTMSCNDKAQLPRRTVGYVSQDFNLLPGLIGHVVDRVAPDTPIVPYPADGVARRGSLEESR